jgi:hypothetical protein
MLRNSQALKVSTRPGRRTAAVALVILAGTLSACSSNTPASTSPQASATPSTFDTLAATGAVKQTWTEFFAKTTPIAQKETLLQNGTTTFKPAVQAFASNPLVGEVTATVSNVTFPDPTTADVTYSISLGGQVVESAMSGTAVLTNGQWLVSDTSLCGLLQLAAGQSGGSATAIPGCS